MSSCRARSSGRTSILVTFRFSHEAARDGSREAHATLERKMAASRKRVDWKTEWTRYLAPVRISPGFWLAPVDSEVRGEGRVIRYRPALAFGDGGHPTTRLASRELERLCASGRFRELLDVGSGTGVL